MKESEMDQLLTGAMSNDVPAAAERLWLRNATGIVSARKKTVPPPTDFLSVIAFFLNRKVKLYQAALLLAAGVSLSVVLVLPPGGYASGISEPMESLSATGSSTLVSVVTYALPN